MGKGPRKQHRTHEAKKAITARVPLKIHALLKQKMSKNNQTINVTINEILERYFGL